METNGVTYKYFLEYKGVKKQIEKEPIGWDGFEEELKRNDKSHGFGVAGSDIGLKFWCDASLSILKSAYQDDIDSKVYFSVEYGDIEEYKGVVDFGSYEEVYGDYRFIEVEVLDENIEVTFFARQDQKVDLDSLVAFDGASLSPYRYLNRKIVIPAKELLFKSEARMEEDSPEREDGVPISQMQAYGNIVIKDAYGENTMSEISSTNTAGLAMEIENNKSGSFSIYNHEFKRGDAVFIFEGQEGFGLTEEFTLSFVNNCVFRKTASVKNATETLTRYLLLVGSDGKAKLTLASAEVALSMNYSTPSQLKYEGNLAMQQGDMIVSCFHAQGKATNDGGNFKFAYKHESSSMLSVSSLNRTADTTATVSMVHESLSRIVESTTNNEISVKSDFYGRPDSDVNPTGSRSEASMRAITNGLRLRNALDAMGSESAFTMSFADIFKGLQPIDNIGYGFVLENGRKYLRIEPYEWFYSSEDVILNVSNPKVKKMYVSTNNLFSSLKIGYTKYETEGTNGLDAFNTEREYRTRLLGNGAKMEQMSPFIADTYAIEATRRLADDPKSKDWRYDNDNFVIQMRVKRQNPVPVPPNYEVAVGASYSNNILAPSSLYNAALSPARMARRWRARLFGWSRRAEQLIYTAGKGNVLAEARIYGNSELIVENGNITSEQSLFKSEFVEFEYPITLEQLSTIKQNPYGIIMLDGEPHFLEEFKHRRRERIGVFKVKPKV